MPTVGERVAGVVTHVEFDRNTCSGYCQLCEGEEVDAVALEVENGINSGVAHVQSQSLKEGDVILALFETDNTWYRGRVLSKDADYVTVFFVDYGNTETVAYDNIREVPQSLVNTPSLARYCNFVEINSSGQFWRDDEKSKVEEMLVNEEFTFEIISPRSGGAVDVKVFNGDKPVEFGGMDRQETSLRTQTLVSGSKISAYVSFVDSANKFWVQSRKQEDSLANLMSDIANHVEKEADLLKSPALGSFCLATYSEDDAPYRSQILSSNSGQCLVQFVDYGNSESKNSAELFSMPDRFRLLPIQGIKCCYKRTKMNPNALEDKLQNFAESGDEVNVHIIGKSGDEYTVELEEIEKESNSTNNNAVAVSNTFPKFPNMRLTINAVIDIGLSYVFHPGCFYVQLMSDTDEIEKINDKMSEDYITAKGVFDVAPGMPCLAKLSDGFAYRCVVKKCMSNTAKVFSVDFGFEEDVDKNTLKAIPSESMSQPGFSVECTVDVTKLEKENWSQKEINLLKGYESEIPLVAKVSSQRGNLYQLDLYDTRDPDSERYLNAELLGTSKGSRAPYQQNNMQEPAQHIKVPLTPINFGTPELLCVTSIRNQSSFYAQFTKVPVSEVSSLQQKLSVIYERPQESISDSSVGTYCAAKYVDGGWYRAIVLSSLGNTTEVGFIDFGDSCSKAAGDLKKLQQEVASMPQLCIVCQLSRVPRNVQKDDMERLILNKAVQVKILSKTEDVFPTYMVEFTDHPNNSAIAGKLSESTRTVPRLPNKALQQPSVGIKSRPSTDGGYPMMYVNLGSTEEVMVTHIAHPELFHCQLSKTATELDEVMEKINAYYPSLGDDDQTLTDCHLGQICAAKYAEDQMWYRAKITGLLAKGDAEVLFVDYGNTECMSRETLKILKPEFLNMPIQAVACGLAGVTAKQGYWSPEDTLKFEEIALDHTFKTTFKTYNQTQEMYSVELVSGSGEVVNSKFKEVETSSDSFGDAWDEKPTGTSSFGNSGFGGNKRSFGSGSGNDRSSFGEDRSRSGRSDFGSNRGRFGDGDKPSGERQGGGGGFGGDRSGGGFGADRSGGGFGADRSGGGSFGADRSGGFRGEGRGGGRGGFGGDRSGGNRGGGRFGGDGGSSFGSRGGGGFGSSAPQSSTDDDWGDGAQSSSGSGGGGFGGGSSGFGSGSGGGGFGGNKSSFGSRSGGSSGFGDDSGGFGGSRGFGSSDRGSFGTWSSGCHKCGQEGHIARECTKKPIRESGGRGGGRGGRDGERSGGGRSCYKCGEEGHFARECPNPDSGGGRPGGGGRSCYKCGEEGHFARECPNPDSGGGRPGFGGGGRGGGGGDRGGRFGGDRGGRGGGFGGGRSGGFGGRSDSGGFGSSGGFGRSQSGGGDDDWGDGAGTGGSSSGFGGKPAGGGFGGRSGGGGGSGFGSRSGGFGDSNQGDGSGWGTAGVSRTPRDKPDFGGDRRGQGGGFGGGGGGSGFGGGGGGRQQGGGFGGGRSQGGGFGSGFGGGSSAPAAAAPADDDWGSEEITTTTTAQLAGSTTGADDTWQHDSAELFALTKLAMGDTVEVFMFVPNNPSEFWCQLVKSVDELETMMEKLNAAYGSLPASDMIVEKPEKGMPCVAMYSEDERWYRGEIVSIADEELEVHFVDYGNSENVNKSKVKAIKPEFMKLPSQSVKCCLRGLKPVNDCWSDKAVEEFEGLTMDKTLSLHVKSYAAGAYIVDLEDKEGDVDVGAKMVELGYCEPQLPESPGKPTKSSVANPFPSLDMSEGEKFTAFVSWVENPQDFWIQPADKESELEELGAKVQDLYSGETGAPEKVEVGLPVIAQFSEDEAWYRAYIEAKKADKLVVRFVDYGNTDTLGTESLRQPSQELLKVPAQALNCSLVGIRPLQSTWNSDSKDIMEEMVKDGATVHLKSKDDVWMVDMDVNGTSVAEELITAAVVRRDAPKTPDKTSARRLIHYKNIPQIPEGSSEKVFVSHVNSLDSFYCQMSKHSGELDDVMAAIDEYCTSGGAQGAGELKISTPCLAQYSADGGWYRATVLAVYPEEADVLFIDYGNREKVKQGNINGIKDEFLDLEPQAIHCTFGMEGSKETMTKLQDLVADKEFTVKALNVIPGKTTVSLIDEKGDDVFSLIQGSETPMETAVLSTPIESEGASLPMETGGETNIIKELPSQELPIDTVTMYASSIDSPSCLYLQKAGIEDDLETISQQLESKYSSLQPSELSLSEVCVGSICCAKYSDDNKWYRAKIQSITEGQAKVVFVDYGNGEETDTASLKALTSDFGSSPMAYECSLADVAPIDGTWSEEATAMFDESVMEQELECRFKSLSEVNIKVSDTDIAKLMIEKGFAIKELATDLKFAEQSLPEGTLKASVSHLENDIFYLQLEKDEEAIGEIGEILLEKCKSSPSCDKVEVGMHCCAKFNVDGYWYRAQVDNVSENDISVHFVDYGNSDSVTKENIRPLDKMILSAPMAYKCCLGRVGQLTSDQIQSLRTLIEEQEVMVQFSGIEDGVYSVSLSKMDGKDIAAELESKPVEEDKVEQECLSESMAELDIRDDAASKSLIVNDTHLTLDVTGFSDGLNESAIKEDGEEKEVTEEDFMTDAADLVPLTLKDGDRLQVSLSHVNSPSSFYIHQVDKKAEIDSLLDEIFELYSNTFNTMYEISEPEEGSLAVALFSEDSSWYRAKVLEALDDKEFKVKFLDYGNTEVCKQTDLRKLLKKFGSQPLQTVECTLGGVRAKDGPWSEEAMALFTEMTSDKNLLMDVVKVGDDGNCIVQLLDMGLSLSEVLIDKGHGVASTTPIAVSQKTKRVFSDSSDVALTPLARKLAEEIQSRGKNNYGSFKKIQIEPDTEYAVSLCHTENPGLFWCQLSDTAADLENMLDRIQEVYKEETTLNLADASEGASCIALNKNDGLFYRAVVVSDVDKDNDSVDVFYVDQGSTLTVNLSDLREMSEEFMVLPAQSTMCRLASVVPNHGEKWSEEACKLFDQLTDDKDDLTVYVEQIGRDGAAWVQLLHGEASIGQSLVEEDHAVLIDTSMLEDSNVLDSILEDSKISDSMLESSAVPDTSLEMSQMTDSFLDSGRDSIVVKLFKHYGKPELLIDTEYFCTVSEVISPSLFFTHLCKSQENLRKIEDEIGEVTQGELTGPERGCQEGIACLCKLETTGKYARATVMGVGEDGVQVGYVDYGKVEVVSSCDIKELPSSLLAPPAQAVPCGLVGVQSSDGKAWSTEVTQFVKDNLEGEVVMYVRNVSVDGIHLVAVGKQNDEGEDLNKQMVDLGLAKSQGDISMFDMNPTSEQEESFNNLTMNRMNSYGSEEFSDCLEGQHNTKSSDATMDSGDRADQSALDTTDTSFCHCVDTSMDTSLDQSQTDLDKTEPYAETTDSSINQSYDETTTDTSVNDSVADTTDTSVYDTSTNEPMSDTSTSTENDSVVENTDASMNQSALETSISETTDTCPADSDANTTNDASCLETVDESGLETTGASDSFHYVNYLKDADKKESKEDEEFFDAEDNNEKLDDEEEEFEDTTEGTEQEDNKETDEESGAQEIPEESTEPLSQGEEPREDGSQKDTVMDSVHLPARRDQGQDSIEEEEERKEVKEEVLEPILQPEQTADEDKVTANGKQVHVTADGEHVTADNEQKKEHDPVTADRNVGNGVRADEDKKAEDDDQVTADGNHIPEHDSVTADRDQIAEDDQVATDKCIESTGLEGPIEETENKIIPSYEQKPSIVDEVLKAEVGEGKNDEVKRIHSDNEDKVEEDSRTESEVEEMVEAEVRDESRGTKEGPQDDGMECTEDADVQKEDEESKKEDSNAVDETGDSASEMQNNDVNKTQPAEKTEITVQESANEESSVDGKSAEGISRGQDGSEEGENQNSPDNAGVPKRRRSYAEVLRLSIGEDEKEVSSDDNSEKRADGSGVGNDEAGPDASEQVEETASVENEGVCESRSEELKSETAMVGEEANDGDRYDSEVGNDDLSEADVDREEGKEDGIDVVCDPENKSDETIPESEKVVEEEKVAEEGVTDGSARSEFEDVIEKEADACDDSEKVTETATEDEMDKVAEKLENPSDDLLKKQAGEIVSKMLQGLALSKTSIVNGNVVEMNGEMNGEVDQEEIIEDTDT